MKLEEVKPRRWSHLRILFEQGDSGIVSGNYDGNERRVIGLRYNGEGNAVGYPSARGYPTFFQFFALPDLECALLSALEKIVSDDPDLDNKYGQAIREELAVFNKQRIEAIERRVRAQVEAEFKDEMERKIQEQIQKSLARESE